MIVIRWAINLRSEMNKLTLQWTIQRISQVAETTKAIDIVQLSNYFSNKTSTLISLYYYSPSHQQKEKLVSYTENNTRK